MTRSKWLPPLAAVGLLVLGSGGATAGLLPSGWAVTPEGGNFRWSYAVVLPTDSQLNTGDYFTIYDFKGLVDGSVVSPSADWTYSVTNTGPTPAGVVPDDDPTVPNLTWKYTGPTLNVGQVGLGNFMATSAFENRAESFFTARTHRSADGKVDTNITTTEVPVPGDGGPVIEGPEPATLALAGLGLPLLGLARLRRRVVG